MKIEVYVALLRAFITEGDRLARPERDYFLKSVRALTRAEVSLVRKFVAALSQASRPKTPFDARDPDTVHRVLIASKAPLRAASIENLVRWWYLKRSETRGTAESPTRLARTLVGALESGGLDPISVAEWLKEASG